MKTARPYQSAYKQTIRETFARGNRDVIAQLSCGLGKTYLQASIATDSYTRGNPVLHTVPRIEIFEQTLAAYQNQGVPVATLTAGKRPDLSEAMIVLAMMPTLSRRGDIGFNPRLIHFDESHMDLDRQIALANQYPKAYRIHWTATPIRTDGRSLSLLSRNLITGEEVGAGVSDSQRNGYLVPCVTYRGPSADLQGIKIIAGEYDKHGLELAYRRPSLIGEVAKLWLKLARGRMSIGFSTGIKHSADLVAECRSAGIRCESVDADTPMAERKAALARLERRQIDILWNCGLFVEGLDLVAVECILECFSTMSLSKHVQAGSRGLRPSPRTGKRDLMLLDFGGNSFDEKHGCIDDDRDWTLGGKTRRQIRGEPGPRTCDSCLAYYPREMLACPRCGAAPVAAPRTAPRVIAADLRPVSKAEAERRQRVASVAVPERPCPEWATAAEWLWHMEERKRAESGYALPTAGKLFTGYTESRCKRWLDANPVAVAAWKRKRSVRT